MSGPITCIIIGDPITALLSAAGIRAAEAIYEGYARADALRGEHAAARDAARALHGAATRQGREALENDAERVEARFDQLILLAERLGAAAQVRATRPVRPEGTDYITVAAYVRALEGLADELQAILLLAAAQLKEDIADQPAAFVLPADSAGPQSTAQRLLARIAHLGPPPEHIATLAMELERTLPGERAELLAMELRSQIQAHVDAAQQRLLQEATGTIIRQSLKDLGYEVEPVADTLFVEGGVMHFRRPDWGNHMVRMRVDAAARTTNFNVVRAVAPGENEQSVLDHIAEDRWCAEFPALLKALEARGVRLDVTRRLAAGALPVQLVERDKLPRFADDEALTPVSKPRARSLK
ncbi:MAG: hypothetical protein ABI831_20975 [Betaproteobacteria bacterium]